MHRCTVHERRQKVTATVHVPYMNSTTCWGKVLKKKKRENVETQNAANVDPNCALIFPEKSHYIFFDSKQTQN